MLESDRPRFLENQSVFQLCLQFQVCHVDVEKICEKYSNVLGGDKSVCTDIAEVTSLVSSVVIESDNNIVLDFSTNIEDGELGSENNEEDSYSILATAWSGASSTSLLSKVIKVCSVFLTNYFQMCIFRNARRQL